MIDIERAVQLAQEEDFEGVQYMGRYKDRYVFMPIYREDGEFYAIGNPRYIVGEGEDLSWVFGQEAFEIMDFFNEKESE